MKKFQTILFLSILIILIPMYVYGVNIEFNIYADSQKYNVDEKDYIIVKIQLGDFINISDNVPLGYTAIIEYDKSIFESVSITGKNEWNAVFNERTNMIEGDTAKASANTEIAKLRFEFNQEEAKQNENTIIKFLNNNSSDKVKYKVTNNSEYKMVEIYTSLNLVTPGLGKIIENPYKVKVSRIIYE